MNNNIQEDYYNQWLQKLQWIQMGVQKIEAAIEYCLTKLI